LKDKALDLTVKNSPGKRLWICRKSDYGMSEWIHT